ncbi:TonB-dependent siderophore receptor [Flavobacterium sp. FlaQc-52]|jgi:iron complex outermembrane receptor protein|uniref:TonB-dependent siderophore receptor n=1 Tax=Flavobacterium sp. FlaQc-52 TaxID=3374185 RepID=UPI0037584A82
MRVKIFLFSLIIFPMMTWAQNSGQIKGKITDFDEKPLDALKVILNQGQQTTYTNPQGIYIFDNLPKGKYEIQVENPVFVKTYTVTIETDQHLVYNLSQSSYLYELETVNVSANRRTIPSSTLRIGENLLLTPQNIQVIDRQVLSDQQILTTADGISRNISGVRTITHQEEGSVGLAVRGFAASNLRNGMDVSGSFGPLREDISFVERIEFVKGPAGFMMGNTQPGGFYNIVTKKPMGTQKKVFQMTLGSYNLYRASADIDEILSKDGKLTGRLNVMGTKKQSFQQYVEHEQYVFNPSLKYDLSENTNVTLEYILSQNSFVGGFAKYSYGIDGFKDVPKEFNFADPIVDPTKSAETNIFGTINHNFNEDWLLVGQFGYVKSEMEGESLYGMYNNIVLVDDLANNKKKGDVQRGISVNDALNTSTVGQVFTRGKFTTGSVNHAVLGGLDMGEKFYVADWTVINHPVGPVFNIYNPVYGKLRKSDLPSYDRSRSLRERGANYLTNYSYTSLHIQDEARFLDDKLRIAGGLRYTNTVKTSGADNGKRVKNDAITPRFSVTGVLSPSWTAYALYDESFQEQTGMLVGGGNADPSYGKNTEIGTKKTWFNSKLMTGLTFYHLTKTNMLTSAGPENPGLSEQTGESLSKGIEFDLNGTIGNNWNVMFNYAFTDAKVTEDNDRSKVGMMLYGTAKHISNAWIKYTITKGSLEGLGFTLGYEYQAKRAAWPVTKEKYLPDNLFSLDSGISYKRSKYQISLLVNNVTNRYNYVGYYPGAWGYKHYGWRVVNPQGFRLNLVYNL